MLYRDIASSQREAVVLYFDACGAVVFFPLPPEVAIVNVKLWVGPSSAGSEAFEERHSGEFDSVGFGKVRSKHADSA